MIAKLTGVIDSLGEDWAVIDVSGVGYLVYCSGRALSRMTSGEAVSLLIETHVRQDHIHLYGFPVETERDWFRLLTTVQGVGAKVGLAILGVLDTDELVHAIAAGDRAMVSRAPGVGAKLATRIISELKDKIADMALGAVSLSPPAALGGSTTDATSALVNLGYNPSQALVAISAAAGKLGGDAGVEALIRGGLAELNSGEHAR